MGIYTFTAAAHADVELAVTGRESGKWPTKRGGYHSCALLRKTVGGDTAVVQVGMKNSQGTFVALANAEADAVGDNFAIVYPHGASLYMHISGTITGTYEVFFG